MSDFSSCLKSLLQSKNLKLIEVKALLLKKGQYVDISMLSRWQTGSRLPGVQHRQILLALGDILDMYPDEKNKLLTLAGLTPIQPEDLDVDKMLQDLGPERWVKTQYLHEVLKWDDRKIGEKLRIAFYDVRHDLDKAKEELALTQEERIKQLAKQHALIKHFDDLVKVADSLRFNLKVPNPKSAQDNALPIDDKKYERLSGLEALEACARDVHIATLRGPKWYCYPDGSVVLGFYAEEFKLFPGLMEHLKGTNLDRQFWDLKELLRDYIYLCCSLKSEVKAEELLNIPKIASLYEKSVELSRGLVEELEKLIHRRTFPGRCRFCP